MFEIEWGRPAARQYETGLDRGVLYAAMNRGRAWDGLVSFQEKRNDAEIRKYYQDGQLVKTDSRNREFGGTLTAFTYPEQFELNLGISQVEGGLYADEQPGQEFGLSYRTMVGNQDGLEAGYKIHLVYNLRVAQEAVTQSTISDNLDLDPFVWEMVARPVTVPGFRPNSHFTIDSRKTNRFLLTLIEERLYGKPGRFARWIDISTLVELFRTYEPTGYGFQPYGASTYGHGKEDQNFQ